MTNISPMTSNWFGQKGNWLDLFKPTGEKLNKQDMVKITILATDSPDLEGLGFGFKDDSEYSIFDGIKM